MLNNEETENDFTITMIIVFFFFFSSSFEFITKYRKWLNITYFFSSYFVVYLLFYIYFNVFFFCIYFFLLSCNFHYEKTKKNEKNGYFFTIVVLLKKLHFFCIFSLLLLLLMLFKYNFVCFLFKYLNYVNLIVGNCDVTLIHFSWFNFKIFSCSFFQFFLLQLLRYVCILLYCIVLFMFCFWIGLDLLLCVYVLCVSCINVLYFICSMCPHARAFIPLPANSVLDFKFIFLFVCLIFVVYFKHQQPSSCEYQYYQLPSKILQMIFCHLHPYQQIQ